MVPVFTQNVPFYNYLIFKAHENYTSQKIFKDFPKINGKNSINWSWSQNF
jgi:hypothetical protein